MARSSFSRGGPPRGLLLLAYLAFAGLFLFACSSSTESQGNHDGFVSDDPDLGDSQYGGGSNGGTGGGGGGGGQGGAEDPERAIEEADIVQTAGDRLYALSRFGGLSVIDIGTQDRLTLLGRFKTEATPFEMYLRGNVVLALFDSYGWYGPNGDWRESSRVLSLDASDPRNVRVLSDTQLAGAVSDSRIVGDVLYVVSHENGYCWECSNTPRTTVTSFDIGSPAQTRQVDMLVFEDSEDDWGWARRSVSVTNQRMYVAGRDWDQTWGSKIQVVDISDPGGDMKLGTSLRAAGEIESRWQMDETDGVLRVISQPGVWNSSEPPELQTFAVESAQAVTHLASLQVLLPKPERLRSVRFDGARAFAITAEQTDPLFTFDLSDPAAPKQLGELEMPGWVYHMEPRGDRLLALGFDNASTEGALHVSIFDVSDLAKPTLLSRVNFGGAWADLPEDQDRIQKAFKLLEPEGLILVPFSGYGTSADPNCWGYTSGVQLIDWGTDSLATRGVAPSVGQARRAWVMNQRLFTVSDDRVETFDLADRDHPSRTAGLTLARNVARSAVVGDRVVRIGASWWSQATLLDVVNKSDASDPSALGELVVDGQSAQGCRYGGSYSELFTHDKTAYVVGSSYDYYYGDGMTTGVSVIDLSNPAEPALVNAYSLSSTGSGWWWSQSGLNGVLPAGSDVAMTGSTLAVLRSTDGYLEAHDAVNATLEVVDLSDPKQPKSTLLEFKQAHGLTGLLARGDSIFTSHYEPTNDGRARFYLDRIDVSDPGSPKRTKVNIPGSLLDVDPASGKLLNVGYQRHRERFQRDVDCYEAHGSLARFEYDSDGLSESGFCVWVSHTISLVSLAGEVKLESSLQLEDGAVPQNTAMGDGVFFAQLTDPYRYHGNDLELSVFSGFAAGQLQRADVPVAVTDDYQYIQQVQAHGNHAALITGESALAIDASSPGEPRVTQRQNLHAYPSSVTLDDSEMFVSLGYDGMLAFPLEAK